MHLKINSVMLEGLVLKPSNTFSVDIQGLFDFDYQHELGEVSSHGSVLGFSKISSKKIGLNILIKNKKDITSLLQLNGILANKQIKLKVDVDGLGFVQTNVVVNSKATEASMGQVISLELTSLSPFLEGSTEQTILKTSVDDGLILPFKTPFSFSSQDSKLGVITNRGNVNSFPRITIYGPAKNIVLQNGTTNQIIWIDEDLEAGDKLIINCNPSERGIYLNGIKRIEMKKGEWIHCTPGVNYFGFSSSSIITNTAQCKIEVVSRFL